MRIADAIVVFVAMTSVGIGQELGSAQSARVLADIHNRGVESIIKYKAAKKITLIPIDQLPEKPTNQSDDPMQAKEGWTGELSYWAFRVLSIIDDDEMLLILGTKTIIWLVDYPTKDFADDDNVRIIGPVRAGETRNYTSTVGSKKSVRTFKLVDGPEVDAYLDGLESREIEEAIKNTIRQLLWKGGPARPVTNLDANELILYRKLIKKVHDQFKRGLIKQTAIEPITIDKKSKRIHFQSDEIKELAVGHVVRMMDELEAIR